MNLQQIMGVIAAALLCAGSAFGMPVDPVLAFAPALLGNMIDPEEMKKLEAAFGRKAGELHEAVQKALRDETSKWETVSAKTNEVLTGLSTEGKKLGEELAALKKEWTEYLQKGTKRLADTEPAKSPGQVFVDSDDVKAAMQKQSSVTPWVKVPGFHKTAVINASGQNQPLVPDQRAPGIISAAERRLTIRDLLPQLRTTSNLVQFARESAFTNNAGPQFSSPNDRENVLKNESAFTFTLENAAVVTIAHWIPASRQVLSDAPGLQSYIDSRLTYGLKLEEEEQLLVGDGTGGNVNGIYTQGTTYNRGVSNDSMIDCLLKAMLQVTLSEYTASGMVLNPIDWTQIQLLKDTQGRYLFTDPQSMTMARMWGLPVVATNTMTSGTFLVGAFSLAAAIWDRDDSQVRVSEHHDDFFARNMVAILAEERLALTVYRTTSMVKGSLPALGT